MNGRQIVRVEEIESLVALRMSVVDHRGIRMPAAVVLSMTLRTVLGMVRCGLWVYQKEGRKGV